MDDIQSLRSELKLKQQQLRLVQEIDKIRDTNSEPTKVFQSVIEMIGQLFEASACYLYLVDRTTGKIKLQASSVTPTIQSWFETLLSSELLRQAVQSESALVWQHQDGFLPALQDGYHGILTPIQMNDEKLGLMIFIRHGNRYTSEDVILLQTAEDQIDSLVLQELVLTHHLQTARELEFRRRELDMLISIDSIRDAQQDSIGLHSAVVGLLANKLQADLCFLFLVDRETGIEELKAMYDQTQGYGSLQPIIAKVLESEAGWKSSLCTWTVPHDQLGLQQPESKGDLHLAAVPIVLNNERLGFFLLVRSQPPFSQEELKLLEAAENQIDSAIVQGYLHDRYQQTTYEVDTIYQIDKIRDQDISMDEMLNHVLQAMVERIKSEMGFIALYDRLGERLELRATTQQDLYQSWTSYPLFEQVMSDALEQGKMVTRQNLAPNIHSIACLPLFLNDQVIGVLGMVNRLGRLDFSQADQRTLSAIGSQIDTAIYERREIRMLRQVLGRSVDPRVMDRLLQNPSLDVLKPERLELTVLYADIRGSTNLAEQTEPEILVEFIRDYLTQMTEVIFAYDGTVDKFVGDEVMALFGAPIPQSDHALRAVRTGLAMQERHSQIMQTWQKQGLSAPPIGIGIVTGRMIIGEMGGSQRANYTVISREANLGARICSAAEGGQVLISESTYQQVRERVVAVPIPGQQFKGVEQPVTVYHIQKVID
jgi:class 3 adenylate cyclase/GTP-sensing pleiotropic transcriptional regulator CodY